MECPKCNSSSYVKNGRNHDKQRYKCNVCLFQFTNSQLRGASKETKNFALKLYLEGMSLRAIGRILKVSNVAVLKWIKKFGEQAEQLHKEEISKLRKVSVMEIDEMHHYIGKKSAKSGCGWLLIEVPKGYLESPSVIVAEKLTAD
jgi:transposase-like protein